MNHKGLIIVEQSTIQEVSHPNSSSNTHPCRTCWLNVVILLGSAPPGAPTTRNPRKDYLTQMFILSPLLRLLRFQYNHTYIFLNASVISCNGNVALSLHQQSDINRVTSTEWYQQNNINIVALTEWHQLVYINKVTSTEWNQQSEINIVTLTEWHHSLLPSLYVFFSLCLFSFGVLGVSLERPCVVLGASLEHPIALLCWSRSMHPKIPKWETMFKRKVLAMT